MLNKDNGRYQLSRRSAVVVVRLIDFLPVKTNQVHICNLRWLQVYRKESLVVTMIIPDVANAPDTFTFMPPPVMRACLKSNNVLHFILSSVMATFTNSTAETVCLYAEVHYPLILSILCILKLGNTGTFLNGCIPGGCCCLLLLFHVNQSSL